MLKILPFLFLLAGTGLGIGAATVMEKPADDTEVEDLKPDLRNEDQAAGETEFVKISNQFVVPIIKGDRVASMIVLSLSLETSPGFEEAVFLREPKLRDAFLRVLFDHSNMDGFRGAFTQSGTLELLKTGLREAAQKELGPDVRDVLIMDIARQDN